MIERLRSLDPTPYYYGSELGLDFFPRPNDLGRFAEFAIANTAAGLDEPRRTAAIKIRNLYDGVGLVGDLADSGYQAVPGGLAGSVHTQILMEHMRGRQELDVATDAAAVTASQGRLADNDGLRLVLHDARGTLDLKVPSVTALRCYVLGWLFGSDEPRQRDIDIEIEVERADGSHEPTVSLSIPASRLVAGIIEVVPSPQHVRRIRLVVSADIAELRVHDLFVVSYG